MSLRSRYFPDTMPLTINSTGVVVVDDSDTSVFYEGTWEEAGTTGELDSTTHGATVGGSTATFVFNGKKLDF